MIEDLLDAIGVEDIQPHENEVGGRCPMHEQRTGERENRPDHWSVNRRSGAHHCFSCEYSGSLIRLIIDLEHVGLWDAHQMLHRFEVDLDAPEEDTWEPPVPSADLETQLEQFGPPPSRAVERRHLSLEALDCFRVRWDYEVSAWIFPIHGPGGGLWGWQAKGAEWVRNRPPGIKKSRTLFGVQVPQNGTQLVLVESPLDAVYLHGLGYTALASYGAGVSDAQMRLVIERFDEVVLALDNDEAGRNETRRLLNERWHHRLPVYVFNYRGTAAKDPGECQETEVRTAMADPVMAALW